MRIFSKTTIVNKIFTSSLVCLLAVFFSSNLKAQLSASIAEASGNYGNGEAFCVDLLVDDFTDFYSASFSISWNSNVLEFVSVEALDADNELNLTDTNFFTNNTDEGLFTFFWEDPDGEGVTINTRDIAEGRDNYGLFRLCFRTSDRCGGFTKIDINEASGMFLRGNSTLGFSNGSQKPADDVFDAEITVEGTPVTITASQAVANPEEIVCITITAEEFSNVEGVQYSLVWDTTILEFQNIANINPDFPSLSSTAINTGNASGEGFIIFSWFTTSGGGVSVPDNTPMYDVCFKVIGEGGDASLVDFSSEPRAIEIATSNEGSDACNLMNDGRISIREQEGEVTIKAGSGGVKPGESICIDFTVQDFIAVNEMNFSVNWDPAILEFESVGGFNLSNLGGGDFFTDNAATGFITFTWDDINGELKQNDEVIFSVCFKAVGPVGSSTPISFSGEPQPILVSTTSTVNAGLNTRNGNVSILPPESLNLNIANATVSPNESFCVDITAENFAEIVSLEFSMGWETTQIDFTSVTNFGVAGLEESDFDLSNAASGFLSLDWSSANAAGENLSDEDVLFSICFTAKANAQLGLCDAIFFNDFPDPIRAVTNNSGGNSIEVTDQGNDICVFDPAGLTVNVTSGLEAAPQEIICVPFTVRNFTDLSTVNFSMNWNPSIYQFASINISGLLTGLNLDNFSTDLANLGIVGLTWTEPSSEGLTLDNGDVIFELCLKAVGERLSCTNIEVTSSPVSFEVKSPITGETNLSLNPLNGQLCVADALEVELVTSESPNCTDSSDGSISVVVNGGNPSGYEYFWTNIDSTGVPVSVSETADNLPAGTYVLNVIDDTGLSLSDTIILEAIHEPPIANAGQDFTLSCGNTTAILQGLGSSVGQNIRFDWNVLQGSGSQINQSLFVNIDEGIEMGVFELHVINDSTTCSARDTVTIFLSDLPNVNAGEDQMLTCQEESLVLDGSNSDQSEGSTFRWTARDGGEITGDSTSITQTITAPGTYILTLTQGEDCRARDTVIVTDARRNILADAGVDKILNCSGEAVTLGGNNTTVDENILIQWQDSEGQIIDTGSDSIEVSIPGIYILNVLDGVSACSATDTVEVIPNEQLPIVEVGFIDQLDCNTSEVTLNINVSNTGGNEVSVQWLFNSVPLANGMDTVFAPTVSEAGFYEVLVTNTTTGCTATLDGIEVLSVTSEPIVNIVGNTVLGCQETASLFLAATGSSSGTNFAYTWSAADTNNFVRTFADSAEVFEAGTYILEVTDIETGCSSIDSVEVTLTEDRPTVSIAAAEPIPCQGGTTTLDGSASSAGTFQWIALDNGAVILDGNEAIATVDAPGLFALRVTNAFGCTALDSILVTQSDTSSIRFEVDYSTRDLTCDVNTASVSINVLSEGDYVFNWSPQNDQDIPDPSAASNEISAPGLILVEVTETNLNCTREAIVVLNLDSELSEIVINNDPESLALDCIDGMVTIDASATNLNDFESFVWKNPNGVELNLVNTLTPQITEPGVYTLLVTNEENGCSDSLSVEVTSASDLEAVIDNSGMLTCADSTLLLRGFNSSSGPNIQYEWSSLEGNNINVPPAANNTAIISAPGTYTLLVRDTETLCEASASVKIEEDRAAPLADAGQDADLGCGGSIRLGGASTTSGETISYAWSLNGQSINQTNAEIDIQAPGTYTLMVTNEQNGCTTIDEVIITQNFQLEQADAGSDEATCEVDSLELFANLPMNATGVWRTNSGAIIGDPNSPETLIGRLDRGNNFFVWTLSTAECPNYSSDTVTISVELAPAANNDRSVLDLDKQDSISIKLVANDNLFNITSWNVEIDQKPSIGSISSLNNGTVTYTASAIKPTTDQFTYTLCSSTCPTLCSSATVTVEIDVPDDASLLDNQPNVITPNGDDSNEQLIFDLLQNGSFPDNDMIIFNRWGDVVYEAAPYNNDWDGRGKNGKPLSEGTYYYILRLDLAEGLILRGDVTILR